MKFKFEATRRYLKQSDKLTGALYVKLQKCLGLLAENPYHPSLRTHKVEGTKAEIFESRVDRQYRLIWQYGDKPGIIILRNVDNHDECLANP